MEWTCFVSYGTFSFHQGNYHHRFATVGKAREAMKAGAVDFIAKPFKISELRDLILRIAQEINTDSPTS